jgi:Glyoxalase-like domain
MTARIANVSIPNHQRCSFTRYRHQRGQRNRMHIDITPFEDRRATREEVEAERDRLVALGASVEKVLTEPWGRSRSSRS